MSAVNTEQETYIMSSEFSFEDATFFKWSCYTEENTL